MSIRSDVQYYFEKNPNKNIYLNDLIPELGLDTKQIQPAIYHLMKTIPELTAVIPGQCWIYEPNKSPSNHTMTVIGETQKGSRVLEDANGILWLARKFEE